MRFNNSSLSQLFRILTVASILLSTSTCVSQRSSTVEVAGPQGSTESVAVGAETAPGDPPAAGRPDARVAMRPGEPTGHPPRPRPCPNPHECGPTPGDSHCPPHCVAPDPQAP